MLTIMSAMSKLFTAVAFPQNLRLDRQLSNSILIGWAPPEAIDIADVTSYNVYVDGNFKMSVRATNRTKALVEAVSAAEV